MADRKRIGERVLALLRRTGLEHTTRNIGQSLRPKVSSRSVYRACVRLERRGLVYRETEDHSGEPMLFWGSEVTRG